MYLKFDAVLRCILGAPDGFRGRKVRFYLSKTKVFEDWLFRPRATLRTILDSKMVQKGIKMHPTWYKNWNQNGISVPKAWTLVPVALKVRNPCTCRQNHGSPAPPRGTRAVRATPIDAHHPAHEFSYIFNKKRPPAMLKKYSFT